MRRIDAFKLEITYLITALSVFGVCLFLYISVDTDVLLCNP